MHSFIPPDRFWAYLTWPEIQALPNKENVVLLQPLGAIEQHGHHLPLMVDAVIATGVLGKALERLESEIPAYVLPTLFYGKSNEHCHFPGTVSLTATTLLQILMEVGESLYQAGFRKLVFVNGHGGQPQVVQIAARDLRQRFKDFYLFPHFVWSVLPPQAYSPWLSALELAEGIHAGDAETSLMLALLPEQVRWDRAVAEYPPRWNPALPWELSEHETSDHETLEHQGDRSSLSLEGACPVAWLTHDLSQTGTIGNPTTASRAKGLAMLDALAAGWAGLIGQIYAFQFPPLNPISKPCS